MDRSQVRVAVVGNGVSGLSTALEFLQRGFTNLHVISDFDPTKDPKELQVSNVACAWWYPSYDGGAEDPQRLRRFAVDTYRRFETLAATEDVSLHGARFEHGLREYDSEKEVPWWASVVRNFRRASKEELRLKGSVSGFTFDSLFFDMSKFMPYLREKVASLSPFGQDVFVYAKVTSLDVLGAHFDVVANCAGLGASQLAGDDFNATKPMRGQVLLVKGPPSMEGFGFWGQNRKSAPSSPTIVLPRCNNTYVVGNDASPDSTDRTVNKDMSKRIWERATRAVPQLKQGTVLGEFVGLRPVREGGPRVELATRNGTIVVHNYGHGGSGAMLCFGCAGEAVSLVGAALFGKASL
ncbi:MAG: hypothetical protein MHM6MM_001495 [Cercozoa sp. M6MM]